MKLFKTKIKSSKTQSEDLPLGKPENMLTALCTNLGCCLLQLQVVETQISILMNHLEITQKGKEIDWIKDGISLGNRINELNKNKILPDDFRVRLDAFRKARNETVHALINHHDFSIFDKRKIAITYLRTRELRIEAFDLVSFFTNVISKSILQTLSKKEQSDVNSIQTIINDLEAEGHNYS